MLGGRSNQQQHIQRRFLCREKRHLAHLSLIYYLKIEEMGKKRLIIMFEAIHTYSDVLFPFDLEERKRLGDEDN